MIEVVLFSEEADSHREAESGAEASTAEPPPPAGFEDEVGVSIQQVGIFADVEDGDPVGPGEEVVLDVAGI